MGENRQRWISMMRSPHVVTIDSTYNDAFRLLDATIVGIGFLQLLGNR